MPGKMSGDLEKEVRSSGRNNDRLQLSALLPGEVLVDDRVVVDPVDERDLLMGVGGEENVSWLASVVMAQRTPEWIARLAVLGLKEREYWRDRRKARDYLIKNVFIDFPRREEWLKERCNRWQENWQIPMDDFWWREIVNLANDVSESNRDESSFKRTTLREKCVQIAGTQETHWEFDPSVFLPEDISVEAFADELQNQAGKLVVDVDVSKSGDWESFIEKIRHIKSLEKQSRINVSNYPGRYIATYMAIVGVYKFGSDDHGIDRVTLGDYNLYVRLFVAPSKMIKLLANNAEVILEEVEKYNGRLLLELEFDNQEKAKKWVSEAIEKQRPEKLRQDFSRLRESGWRLEFWRDDVNASSPGFNEAIRVHRLFAEAGLFEKGLDSREVSLLKGESYGSEARVLVDRRDIDLLKDEDVSVLVTAIVKRLGIEDLYLARKTAFLRSVEDWKRKVKFGRVIEDEEGKKKKGGLKLCLSEEHSIFLVFGLDVKGQVWIDVRNII